MKILGHAEIMGEASGSFKSYDALPENPKVGTWALVSGSLMLCAEVNELPVWVPLTQERNTYIHDQKTPASVWSIPHQLGSSSVLIQCFDALGNTMIPNSVKSLDNSIAEITFPENVSGKAIAMYGFEHGASSDGTWREKSSGLPVGAIVAFSKVPKESSGFLPCSNFGFSRTQYPELFEFLGSDHTPNFTDRYLKMIGDDLSPLQTVAWQIPEHSHNFSATTDSDSHSHKTSVPGNLTHVKSNYVGSIAANTTMALPASGWSPQVYGGGGSGPTNGLTFHKSGASDRGSNSVSHSHKLSGVTSGIKEALNKGTKVEVDHVGVVYCIKATSTGSDEARIGEAYPVDGFDVATFEDHPVGSTINAWGGVKTIGTVTKIYITNSEHHDIMPYGSDTYGNHSSGKYIKGDWIGVSYCGAYLSDGFFMFRRIK